MNRGALCLTIFSLISLLCHATPTAQSAGVAGALQAQVVSAARTLCAIQPQADFITLSPDQTLLFACYSKKKDYHALNEGWLKVWSLPAASPNSAWEWKLSGYRIIQMAVAPDGQTLAAVCSDAKTRFWNASTSRFLGALALPSNVPGREHDQFTANDPNRDADNFGDLRRPYPTAVTYSPDGHTLAIGGGVYKRANSDREDPNRQSMIQLLDTRTLTRKRVFFILGAPATMRFAPDNARITISCYTLIENQVAGQRAWGAGSYSAVWDVKTGQQAKSLGTGIQTERSKADYGDTALSPDGKTFAVRAGIYEAQTGTLLQRLNTRSLIVYVIFSPASESLISVDAKGLVQSWHLK